MLRISKATVFGTAQAAVSGRLFSASCEPPAALLLAHRPGLAESWSVNPYRFWPVGRGSTRGQDRGGSQVDRVRAVGGPAGDLQASPAAFRCVPVCD